MGLPTTLRLPTTLLLLALLAARAQGEVSAAKSGRLRVTGSASVTVEPDTGKIYESVIATLPTVSAACELAANTTDAVISAAEESGDSVKVTTENISVWPNITYSKNGKQESNGFICQQTLLIRVKQSGGSKLDVDISAALDATLKAGGDMLQVSFMSTDLSDDLRNKATDQARESAVANAFDTANIVAKAAKVQLGAVLSIVDSNVAPYEPFDLAQPASVMQEQQAGEDVAEGPASYWSTAAESSEGGAISGGSGLAPIQTGTTDVAAFVVIDYAITPRA